MSDNLKISELPLATELLPLDLFPLARDGGNLKAPASLFIAKLLAQFANKGTLDGLSHVGDQLRFNGVPINTGSFSGIMVITENTTLTDDDMGKLFIVNPVSSNITITVPSLVWGGDPMEVPTNLLAKPGLSTVFARTENNDWDVTIQTPDGTMLGKHASVNLSWAGDSVDLSVSTLTPAMYLIRFSRGFEKSLIHVSSSSDILKAIKRFSVTQPGYILLSQDITLTSTLTLDAASLILGSSPGNRFKLILNNNLVVVRSAAIRFFDMIIVGDKINREGSSQSFLRINSINLSHTHRVAFNRVSFHNLTGETVAANGLIQYSIQALGQGEVLPPIEVHFEGCEAHTPPVPEIPGEEGFLQPDLKAFHIAISYNCTSLKVMALLMTNQVNGMNYVHNTTQSITNAKTFIHDGTADLELSDWDNVTNLIAQAAGTGDTTQEVINAASLASYNHIDDTFPFIDSQNGNILKRMSWSNIIAQLQTAFDAIYSTFSGNYGDLNGIPSSFTPEAHGDEKHSENYLKAPDIAFALSGEDLGHNTVLSENLIFHYKAGKIRFNNMVRTYNANSLLLPANQTVYIEASPNNSNILVNISGFTPGNYPLYMVTTSSVEVVSIVDQRSWLNHNSIVERGVATFSSEEIYVSANVSDYLADCDSNHVNFVLPTGSQFENSSFTFRHIAGANAMTAHASGTSNIICNTKAGTELTTTVPGSWFTLKFSGSNFYVTAASDSITEANIP